MLTNLPITGLPLGQVPPAVIVCGDPDRATMAAGLLDSSDRLSEKREYRCYRGKFQGMTVAICSHGIGSPGAAIAFEELIQAGARQIIRVGTCGALQPELVAGQLVIATAAVQNTGYGLESVPAGYPPVADLELTQALKRVATDQGKEYVAGIVLSRDNFYAGVDGPSTPDYQTLSAANVQAVEMECASLFIIGNLRKIQTAAILAIDGNVLLSGGEKMESYAPGLGLVQAAVNEEIIVALKALYLNRNESS
jgi:uridine phosphorylase